MNSAAVTRSVFVHVVTFNSAKYLQQCLAAVVAQEGFTLGENLELQLTDNASTDQSIASLDGVLSSKIKIFHNKTNLGFCAAHNQGVKRFLDTRHDYLLILNPDLKLDPQALRNLVGAIAVERRFGMSCPRLLRADQDLNPVSPPQLDAAGMRLTSSLRHFDRGSGEPASEKFLEDQEVFGGSGACLLLSRECVQDLLLVGAFDRDIVRVYPELSPDGTSRAPLFDEAFFAFREDADLAWRANNLGWRCIFASKAKGWHVRNVLPERRASLPKEINLWGVRNRFLLQINNYYLQAFPAAFIPGVLIRNMVVICGTILVERSSFPALWQVLKLWRRAWARRRVIYNRAVQRGTLWRVK